MWVWLVALLGTLAAFAVAWRALQRADAAVAAVRTGVEDAAAIERAGDELSVAAREAARQRMLLHSRTS